EGLTRYQFTGRERDPDTGLQYNRARWYDPRSGQWMEEDPEGFAAGDANLRRYVGNGVTNGTDPSGRGLYPRSFERTFIMYGFPDNWTGWSDEGTPEGDTFGAIYGGYLTDPSSMDDDLSDAFYISAGTSGAALAAAGGLVVAGYGGLSAASG